MKLKIFYQSLSGRRGKKAVKAVIKFDLN